MPAAERVREPTHSLMALCNSRALFFFAHTPGRGEGSIRELSGSAREEVSLANAGLVGWIDFRKFHTPISKSCCRFSGRLAIRVTVYEGLENRHPAAQVFRREIGTFLN